MTDRELLELAAKAVGIEKGEYRIDCGISTTNSDGRHGYLPRWNPLTDDGDALRLAVKLGMDVCIDTPHENEPRTYVICFSDTSTATTTDAIENHGDPYAATRRAIVRAAAEIGKQMAPQELNNAAEKNGETL